MEDHSAFELFDGEDDELDDVQPVLQMAKHRRYASSLPEVVGYAWSCDTLRGLFPARFAPLFISSAVGLALDLSDIGGGRGFVAERDVAAGELLLVERPLWKRLGTLAEDAASLAEMCRSDNEIAAALRAMHPVGESLHVERLQNVWRLSAFESGLYAYQSLFNDSHDAPCIQLHIAEEGIDQVWCTRPIFKGEPLTLSYVQPVDASAARRAWVLQHHGFLGEPLLQTGTDVEAALDYIEETDDAVHDILEAALDAVAAASATHEPAKVRRRAWGVLARVTDRYSLSGSSVALRPSLHAKVATCLDGAARNCLSFSVLIDLLALKASFRWLHDLDHDPKRGPLHPDVAQAAAIGAGALNRLINRASTADLAAATGRSCSVTQVNEDRVTLQARADAVANLYDSRRWLIRPEVATVRQAVVGVI